ncbi:hypothetical protein Tco_0756493 [Tanacetum coccineum]
MAIDTGETEGAVFKAFLVSGYLLEIREAKPLLRETVHETNIDFVFRHCHTIIGKLIEQGLVTSVGLWILKLVEPALVLIDHPPLIIGPLELSLMASSAVLG